MTDDPIILLSPATQRLMEQPPSRRWWGTALFGLPVFLAVGAGTLWYPRSRSDVFVVRRGEIVHSLVALGRVESETTLEVVPRITARIKAVHVDEGDTVKPGQLLVSLEDDTIRALLEEASRGRDAAKSRRDEVLRGTRAEDLQFAKAAAREAEHELHSAEARLAEILRGSLPEEIAEAEAGVARAKAEVDFSTTEWERVQELWRQGVASVRQRDNAKRQHESAMASLRQAEAERDRVLRGGTDERKAEGQSAVEAARARLDQARATLSRLQSGATDEERRSAEAEFESAQAVVARLQFELSHALLHSAIHGVVLRRYKEPSELAFANMSPPILVVAEEGVKVVRIEVSETDLHKVHLGQKVTITSDAYPGQRWMGRVTRLAPVLGRKRLATENPKERSDVKVLEARVLPDEPLEMPFHLPVEARICEVVREAVLVVPRRAVDATGRVQLADGSGRAIETGACDETFVEVLSGLSEGEELRLAE